MKNEKKNHTTSCLSMPQWERPIRDHIVIANSHSIDGRVFHGKSRRKANLLNKTYRRCLIAIKSLTVEENRR
jgi:hypothetical protein